MGGRKVQGWETAGHIKASLALRSSVFSHHAGIHSHAPKWERTAYGPANAGSDAEETEGPFWGTAWLLSAYAVSGPAGRTQRRRAYGQASPMGDALHSIASTLRPHSPPLHPQNQPSAE